MSTEARRKELVLKYLVQPRTVIALANALFGTHAAREAHTRQEVLDTLEALEADGLVARDGKRWAKV